jgi:hypothetical protein
LAHRFESSLKVISIKFCSRKKAKEVFGVDVMIFVIDLIAPWIHVNVVDGGKDLPREMVLAVGGNIIVGECNNILGIQSVLGENAMKFHSISDSECNDGFLGTIKPRIVPDGKGDPWEIFGMILTYSVDISSCFGTPSPLYKHFAYSIIAAESPLSAIYLKTFE